MEQDENISAFAFRTGKQIETLIKEETDDLVSKNNLLMSRILNWYTKTRDESFAEYMCITKDNYGR